MSIISGIFAAILGNKFIATIIASGIAILGAWMHGRRKGKAAERQRQNRARQKTNRNIDKIEEGIAGWSPDDIRKRLKKWSAK